MRNKVGLGTFPLASPFKKISVKDAEKVVRTFIDEGGYYIDTAPLYGNGEIESLLGRVLKKFPRNKYYLGTKTVKIVDSKGNLTKSGKFKDVVKGLDYSLQRLRLDHVDQLMVHSVDSSVQIEETLEAMEQLQKQGKVKDLAVSNVNLRELKKYNKTGKIKYVQNKYSLVNRSINSEFEEYLLKYKIFLIPYHLLEIGLLTGIAFEDYKISKDDMRNNLTYWDNNNQMEIFKWVRESLAPIAKNVGCTVGQLNIAWGLSRKFIDWVIVGTRNLEYLKINLSASSLELDKNTLIELDGAYADFESKIREKYNRSIKEFRGLNDKFY